MIQIELTDEQFRKLQNFLSDTKEWSRNIEIAEEMTLSRSLCADRSYYEEEESRIWKEAEARDDQIEEIQQMFGG